MNGGEGRESGDRYRGSPRFLTARKGPPADCMQEQVLRVEPCRDRNSDGSIPPTLSLPANWPGSPGKRPGSNGQAPQGRGQGPRLFSPPPLRCSPLHCSLPREGVGATCTWPGQERKVTHTKFNNQQRHILAGRCSHQAIPPHSVQSPWPAPNSLLGPEKRGAGPCRVSLSRLPPWHLLDRRWRERGGAWASRPHAGAPRAEVCPTPPQSSLLGQVNSGCCFGTRRSR